MPAGGGGVVQHLSAFPYLPNATKILVPEHPAVTMTLPLSLKCATCINVPGSCFLSIFSKCANKMWLGKPDDPYIIKC